MVGIVGAIGETRGVLTMNEPQVWTLIGVFSALMFGMLGVVSSLFVRVLRSEIGGLESRIGGEIGGWVRARRHGLAGGYAVVTSWWGAAVLRRSRSGTGRPPRPGWRTR